MADSFDLLSNHLQSAGQAAYDANADANTLPAPAADIAMSDKQAAQSAGQSAYDANAQQNGTMQQPPPQRNILGTMGVALGNMGSTIQGQKPIPTQNIQAYLNQLQQQKIVGLQNNLTNNLNQRFKV
jgi:hypothetical protein